MWRASRELAPVCCPLPRVALVDVTDRIDHTATPMPAVGTRVMSLQPAPALGTWEMVDHQRCSGNGRLKALTRGETAPLCDICGDRVPWQLSHLAPSVASDHDGVGQLP